MTKIETIPAEEGASLLPQKPQSTGIRRVVAAAAVASFVIGVLAATAVQSSPGRHASNLHSKHKYETTEVDDEGPHPYYWDDAISSVDDGIETEACERKCTTDADCATRWPEFNECGVCQNWGDDPDMECDGTPRPDQPVTIKSAHISLVSDSTKCLTVPDRSDLYLTLEKCGGGDGSGDHSKQRFTYTYKDGSGRITYDHPTGLVNSLTIDMGGGDGTDMVLWFAESDSEMPSQNLHWVGGGSSSSRRLQAIEKKEFLYPNMTADAEGRRLSTWAGLWEHSGFSCPADMYDATGGDSNYWACGKGCAGGKQTDGTCNCACQCRSGSPAELRNSDGPCELGGKEITIQNGEGLCVAASGTKNGKRIIAQKCKAGSSKQQWQIGPM